MNTPSTKYRLEQEYRTALRKLGEYLHAQGRLPYASEAQAIRFLVREAAEKIWNKFPLPT